MVYKKYIKRNGKIYGPYFYKSIKKNGKVITEYVGGPTDKIEKSNKKKFSPKKIITKSFGNLKKETNVLNYRKVTVKSSGKSKNKKIVPLKSYFFIIVFGLVIISSLILIPNLNLTGGVVLDMGLNYEDGEYLKGILIFSLTEEELIPASTNVLINLDNISYEYALSDLVTDELMEGDFYVQGKNISGSGEGYGFVKGDISSNVSFVLEIYSEIVEEDIENVISEENNISIEDSKEVNITGEIESKIPVEKINESEEIIIEVPVENVKPEIPVSEVPIEELEETESEVPVEVILEGVEIISESEVSAEKIEAEVKEEVSQDETEETEPKEETSVQEIVEVPIVNAIIVGLLKTVAKIFLSMTGQVSLELDTTIQGNVSFDKSFTYDLEEGQTAEIVYSSQDVNLVIEDNTVIITTDYIGETTKNLEIDFEKLNILAKEGVLEIILMYENVEIYSENKIISFEEVIKDINETLIETNLTNPVLNETLIEQNVTISEEILNQTLLIVNLNKNTYYQNETIDIFGEVLINGEKINENLTIEIEVNDIKIFNANINSINGSYFYSLLADFENSGIYSVNVSTDSLSEVANFYFLLDVIDLENYKCKKFKENILWSSGYTHLEEGATNYETWYPKNNCSEIGQVNCILHNVSLKSRFRYLSPYDEVEERESYVKISKPDATSCNNPEQGEYSKYIAFESLEPEEETLGFYCGKNKNFQTKCGVEISDSYLGEHCYGIKSYASQYCMIDVVEIKYDLCWEK